MKFATVSDSMLRCSRHVKWPGNKPQNFMKSQFSVCGKGLAMNGTVLSGFQATTYIFWVIGKNPKVFDKKFDEKS